MNDPLFPDLIRLLTKSPKGSFVLGGGLGLRVKQAHQIESRIQSLAQSVGQELPEARATTDIDLFLKIEIFARSELGLALRQAINELGYKERTPKWQFEKEFPEFSGSKPLVLDLLARTPYKESGVRTRSSRVGSGSGVELHGRETIEAFAVEDSPIVCNFTDGMDAGQAQVAHPYAMLNMKIRAAHDWLRFQENPWSLRDRQEPPSAKHAFDGAFIIAMLTKDELAACDELSSKWAGLEVANQIKKEAVLLYGTETSPGWIEARRQGIFNDHPLIWETMRQVLGLD